MEFTSTQNPSTYFGLARVLVVVVSVCTISSACADAYTGSNADSLSAGVNRTLSVSRRLPSPEQTAIFRALAEKWATDTLDVSSLSEMTNHPAYQQIMAMGDVAIPLLLAQLQSNPDYWFDALIATTQGINPVPPEHAGNLRKMTEAWLQWGRQAKYL